MSYMTFCPWSIRPVMTHHFMRDKKRIQTQVKGEMNHFSWQSFHLFNISVVGLKMAFLLWEEFQLFFFPPNFPFSSPWSSSGGFNWVKSWHKFRCVSPYWKTLRKYKFFLPTKAFNTRFCKKDSTHFFYSSFNFVVFPTWQPF